MLGLSGLPLIPTFGHPDLGFVAEFWPNEEVGLPHQGPWETYHWFYLQPSQLNSLCCFCTVSQTLWFKQSQSEQARLGGLEVPDRFIFGVVLTRAERAVGPG